MVKFAKQLELQLVPEWRGAYCQYKTLKKSINKIKENPLDISDGPGLNSFSGNPLDRGHSCRKSFWSHIDLIQVHGRKPEIGDYYVYETELLGPIAHSEYDQAFFKSLDAQLNKVNEFYKRKEDEFIQRGAILDKQICALTGVKKLLEQGRIRQDGYGTSGRQSELGDAQENMEGGFYDQNVDLLESIAKATFAASGLPTLPLRRRTIEPVESSSLGSTSSPASTEVSVGSMSRNSQYTSRNQVRLIIPRTTPAATLAALAQMLWEDVFRQSKKASTLYRGREDYIVSQKKIQSATLMLRAAYVEFYRGLGLLKSYSSLNVLAFAKIMKKYDKVTSLCVAEKYMHHVERTYVNSSDKVAVLMDRVEEIYTEHFTGGHRRQAMAALRPMQQSASHHVTYFLGFFTGCSVALIAAFGVLLRLGGDYSDKGRVSYLHTIFPTFSMLALVLLHMYLYGWNIFLWKRARINYAFIFEFSPGSELRYREVLLVCTALTTLVIGAMVVHLSIHSTLIPGQASPYIDLIPVTVMLIFLALLLNPLNICYRSSRFFFLNVFLRIICAPLSKVMLADFFVADQLTSQVSTLRNLEFVLCYYCGGYFLSRNSEACTKSKRFDHWTYVIALLPYWWRFWQCFRRWAEEKDFVHLANAGKYLSAMVAVALKITYSKNSSVGLLVTFFIASTIATIYQVYWDTFVDWGLLRRDSKNRWLRDELLLKRKWIYFASMALNVFLRMAWLQSMTHFTFGSLDSSVMNFLFAALEILRRGHWNFYRLENEHLNNVGRYRATKQVPLPFEDTTSEI
ncbi:phosphate transporter PHO1-3 [Physcomitrium patens]|uniref:PHO1-7 n=1 Tax=Physcomitrium patens TaxID=3218 RepID=A9LSG1_PHYPA|nr:phosphate transporter PHO1-3-like [Physcomitrium patens]XP_024383229.1 phosphate transporter PHO1-3-like [Physcomitrium patens]XP_024383230.1 phosphate transporter PHO1-3-like [Physcomitrium patens]XP_024383231.1 phosphate transporter PHO1-3-like [Physcomitrium patens]XP_024383232.1 phosphate transporter PHO1-3-like [Physcomitrium patens]XP_024383233.1 phosphate transporter PHO1-3-like [Physcomitrium patens]ABX46618.1 PHO1-7 [Physcomitrium patens]PNR49878.1 hypothetical protein PHYPA_0117|eukprot:XP_024383228.1 phosphate transporter PHO1-3-like [Physcomitrella patens]